MQQTSMVKCEHAKNVKARDALHAPAHVNQRSPEHNYIVSQPPFGSLGQTIAVLRALPSLSQARHICGSLAYPRRHHERTTAAGAAGRSGPAATATTRPPAAEGGRRAQTTVFERRSEAEIQTHFPPVVEHGDDKADRNTREHSGPSEASGVFTETHRSGEGRPSIHQLLRSGS